MAPLETLVRPIAGPDADVFVVVPRGGPLPPTTLPTPNDLIRGRLLVTVGLGLDGWSDSLVPGLPEKFRTVRAGDRVPTIAPTGPSDFRGADGTPQNPYFWLDPERARLLVKAIAEEMARADANHANAYRARAGTFDADLSALDAEVEGRMKPLATRTDLGAALSRDARFAYFAERYHLPSSLAAAGTVTRASLDGFDPFGGADYASLVRLAASSVEALARKAATPAPSAVDGTGDAGPGAPPSR
ncbi:MAG: metal ABC transporter substrate-binding protein [Polyangiaceae bacterium]